MKLQRFFTKFLLFTLTALFVFSPLVSALGYVAVNNAYAQTPIVANDDTVTMKISESSLEINILANDSGDIDKQKSSVISQATGGIGALQINPITGTAIYTRSTSIPGIDSFVYEVCNTDKTDCKNATVTINITTDGNPPVDTSGSTPGTQVEETELASPCGLGPALDIGSSVACWIGVLLVRTLWFGGTQVIVTIVGGAMDFFLFYTGQSSTYKNIDFILVGWGIVRDISNIVLIAGLVMIAISMMLNRGNAWKKSLSQLIVVALLVNFSLFFTQVIVDASHILARVFYNSIVTGTGRAETAKTLGYKYVSISEILINKMNPQRFVSGDLREKYNKENSSWFMSATAVSFFFVIHIVMGFVNIMMIGVFGSILYMMIGRTIQLMFSMIGAPFAFASMVIPQLQGTPKFSFGNWISDLTKTAFTLPVFLFFMYLIALFIDLGDQARVANVLETENISWIDGMINIAIPILLVLGLLQAAKSATKKMASEITNQVGGAVQKVVSGTLGAAAAAGFVALTAATGGLAAGAGSQLAKSGAAKLASGRNALKAAKIAKDPAKIAAAKVQMARGAKLKAQGERMRSFTNKQMDIRNIKVGGVGIGDFGKAIGLDIGRGSTDTSTARSREKAVKEKKIVQIQQDIDDGTGSIKDALKSVGDQLKEFQKLVERRKEKLEKDYKEWEKKEQDALDAGGPSLFTGFKKTDDIVKRKYKNSLETTMKAGDIEDDDGNLISYATLESNIKTTKDQMKDLKRDIILTSESVLTAHVEKMKSGFSKMGMVMRDAITNGIKNVTFTDVTTNMTSNDFTSDVESAVKSKIRGSL